MVSIGSLLPLYPLQICFQPLCWCKIFTATQNGNGRGREGQEEKMANFRWIIVFAQWPSDGSWRRRCRRRRCHAHFNCLYCASVFVAVIYSEWHKHASRRCPDASPSASASELSSQIMALFCAVRIEVPFALLSPMQGMQVGQPLFFSVLCPRLAWCSLLWLFMCFAL